MKLRVVILFALAASLATAQGQVDNLPAAPKNGQSVQALIDDLIRRGVVPSQDAMGHRTAKGNRYEQAVYVYAAYQTLIQPKLKRRLCVDYGDLLASLSRAAATLERELSSLGVDVVTLRLHLRALALGEGFPDVPPTHWASKATRELKDLGLLKGYPDGLFRGE